MAIFLRLGYAWKDRETKSEFHGNIDRWIVLVFKCTVITTTVFAALHKVNSDFFISAISCGTMFYEQLVHRSPIFGWVDISAQMVPIIAFLTEALIPILLLVAPRIGILFTAIAMGFIGLSGAAAFPISVLLFSLAFLSANDLPTLKKDTLEKVATFVVCFLFVSIYLYLHKGGIFFLVRRLWVVFVVLNVAIFTIHLIFTIYTKNMAKGQRFFSAGFSTIFDHFPLPISPQKLGTWCFAFLVLLPQIFNGLTPYLGFKFNGSYAMYSNLRADGMRWNSLVFPKSLQFSDPSSNWIIIENVQVTPVHLTLGQIPQGISAQQWRMYLSLNYFDISTKIGPQRIAYEDLEEIRNEISRGSVLVLQYPSKKDIRLFRKLRGLGISTSFIQHLVTELKHREEKVGDFLNLLAIPPTQYVANIAYTYKNQRRDLSDITRNVTELEYLLANLPPPTHRFQAVVSGKKQQFCQW